MARGVPAWSFLPLALAVRDCFSSCGKEKTPGPLYFKSRIRQNDDDAKHASWCVIGYRGSVYMGSNPWRYPLSGCCSKSLPTRITGSASFGKRALWFQHSRADSTLSHPISSLPPKNSQVLRDKPRSLR